MRDPDEQSVSIAKDFLEKIVDPPLREIGGLLQDYVNYWRFKNKINIILKAKKFLEERGIKPCKALPETVIPLLECAADTEDKVLSDMFAELLAAHLSQNNPNIHPSYAKVLNQLSPCDAHFLKWLVVRGMSGNCLISEIIELADISSKEATLVIRNLERLGICQIAGVEVDKTGLAHYPDQICNDTNIISLTTYGFHMVTTCVGWDEIARIQQEKGWV